MPERTRAGSGGGRTATKGRSTKENPATSKLSETELRGMKLDELRKLARDRGVGGTSAMRKDDLVKEVARIASQGSSASSGGRKPADGEPERRRAKGGEATADQSGKGQGGRGVRRGSDSSKSLKYSQEVTSPDEKPERPGRSLVTTNHEVIRRWAEERDATPATIEGTEHDNRPGTLRFDFPPGDETGRIRHISWEEWFTTFDARGLNFIYQEQRSDKRQSNFFRLENPDREDA